jgi:putative Holliday junction resolvase
MLIEANVSRKKRKGVVDRVAAALLLQSYLQTLTADDTERGVRREQLS